MTFIQLVRTEQFFITVTFHPEHGGSVFAMLETVSADWERAARACEEENGTYIKGVVTPGARRCNTKPVTVLMITGSRDPAEEITASRWSACLQMVLKAFLDDRKGVAEVEVCVSEATMGRRAFPLKQQDAGDP